MARRRVDQEIRLNPAWTNSALYRQWSDIEREVGPEWMPKLNYRTTSKLSAIEYGTGAYGTVMPTHDPNIVIKITSDETEAQFVALVLAIGEQPEGLVRYEKIFRLEGMREGLPIYVLWREEAHRVGKALDDDDASIDFEDLLLSFRVLGQRVFWDLQESGDPYELLKYIKSSAKKYLGRIDVSDLTDPDRTERAVRGMSAGKALAAAVKVSKEMAHDSVGYAVGDAIDYYLSEGILLSDIHDGNLGRVTRSDEEVIVITDPGQVVLLTSRYNKVRVPRLISSVRTTRKRRVA